MLYKVLSALFMTVMITACSRQDAQSKFVIQQIESKTSFDNVQPADIRNVKRGKFRGTSMDVWCGEIHLPSTDSYVGGWRPFSIMALNDNDMVVDVWRKFKVSYNSQSLDRSVAKVNEAGAKSIATECEGLLEVESAANVAEVSTKAPSARDDQGQAAWYEGGTLHNASGAEWLAGTAPNRLATSADFIAKLNAAESVPQLKTRATALSHCITEAVSTPAAQDVDVKDVAVSCVILLGYK